MWTISRCVKTILAVAVAVLLLTPSSSEAQGRQRYVGQGNYMPESYNNEPGWFGYGYNNGPGPWGYTGDSSASARYPSNYPAQNAVNGYSTVTLKGAILVVRLPAANAELWLQNTPMQEQGIAREFHTAALDPSSNYAYTVRARWTQNGNTVEETRQVPIRSGQTVSVDFGKP